jgi:CPA2 family monovalent cation:H+ antiporter-2
VALPIAVASAFVRAQIGEFSFVLQQVGNEAGLSPGDLGEDGVQAFLAGSVLLMILTPAFAPLGAALGRRFERPDTPTRLAPQEVMDDERSDHVIIAGYGATARSLVPGLRAADIPFVVLTLSPTGAAHAEAMGLPVLRGDSSKRHALEEAGVRRARSVVIADDEPEMAQRITEVVQAMNAETSVIVRTDHHDVEELARAGADVIVGAERASADALRDVVVRDYFRGIAAEDETPVDTQRVVHFDPYPTGCGHYDAIRPVLPSAPGCEECLQLGDEWVHLRVCVTCGHVGCCDDSPNRHARAHSSPAHPIMRSIEPEETWGWCFVDELELADRDAP